MLYRILISALVVGIFSSPLSAQADKATYAEKLGWPKGTRALILHIDDTGMSWESNQGTIRAMSQGVATSCSVMMTCPWVSEIVKWLKANPKMDAGLHLTLNAEWEDYRWGPIAGKLTVPGLVDSEGALWHTSEQTVQHATADEVEIEVRAQIDRARTMGFEPTHLDTHMGTILETEEFTQRYVKIGIEMGIPLMFPGGHNFYAYKQYGERAGDKARQLGNVLWNGGLPVIDDLHNTSYEWPDADKANRYIEAVKGIKPGVTMIIMHCASSSDIFKEITSSGVSRLGDLNAMLDPRLRKTIEDEGIVLTTWRELKTRREMVKDTKK